MPLELDEAPKLVGEVRQANLDAGAAMPMVRTIRPMRYFFSARTCSTDEQLAVNLELAMATPSGMVRLALVAMASEYTHLAVGSYTRTCAARAHVIRQLHRHRHLQRWRLLSGSTREPGR